MNIRLAPSTRLRPLLARSLAWTLAVWIVHILLRLAVLGRPDAFGVPFVGKLDWYVFHAIFFDLRWISWLSLPLVAHVAFWEVRHRGWARLGLWALYAIHALLLVATLVDHETYRFMGCHASPSFFTTYGNGAATRQVLGFLANDKGGRFLPLVLLAAILPLAAWLQRLLRRRPAFSDTPNWKLVLLGALLLNLVGWIFTEVAWGGSNRARKLAPVVSVWWEELHQKHDQKIGDDEFRRLTAAFRTRWKAENGSDTLWDFPDPALPYWKTPRGGEHVVPRDSQWNIVLIVLESHRAYNCGFLKPYGAARDATPFLDSIVPGSETWVRYQCPALPTVRALASIHLGILNHPDRNFTSDNASLSNLALPAILSRAGWTTRFFSAADPAWDNENPWLRQWYQHFDYDRSRENDGALFTHAARWMHDSLHVGHPFFVTFMTKTNHYPFNPEPGVEASPAGDLQARMRATQRYADRQVGNFVNALRREPWFSRTVFVITGDHGFPLGEHYRDNIGYGLYSESVWLPLVIFGNHPLLRPGTLHSEPASHLDLAPTLLSLAGVRAANHFTGRNLLLPPPPGLVRVTTNFDEALAVSDSWRVHGTLSGAPREHGSEVFAASDLRESRPIPHDTARSEAMVRNVRDQSRLLEAVLQRDALCPRHTYMP